MTGKLYGTYTKFFLYAIILIMLALMFIDIPGSTAYRSVRKILDSGHVIFFLIFSLTLMHSKLWPNQLALSKQLLLIFLITLILSVSLEGIQVFTYRDADIGDVGRNLLGTTIAILFTDIIKKLDPLLRLILKIAVSVMVLFTLLPVGRSLVDDYITYTQFPILANFETPFELGRWTGSSHFYRDDRYHRDGEYALCIEFINREYSGARLRYFPQNWSAYNYLNFSIFNPDADTLNLTVRVHDKEHIFHDEEISDRYNRLFKLSKGWHDIQISLNEIRTAPRSRHMNMKKISGLMFFTRKPYLPKQFYLDRIYLSDN